MASEHVGGDDGMAERGGEGSAKLRDEKRHHVTQRAPEGPAGPTDVDPSSGKNISNLMTRTQSRR